MTSASSKARPNIRPNILWYCADRQRYDTIHALGQAPIATPNLDPMMATVSAGPRRSAAD